MRTRAKKIRGKTVNKREKKEKKEKKKKRKKEKKREKREKKRKKEKKREKREKKRKMRKIMGRKKIKVNSKMKRKIPAGLQLAFFLFLHWNLVTLNYPPLVVIGIISSLYSTKDLQYQFSFV